MPVFGTGSKSTWWAGSEPVRFQPMSFRAPRRMGMSPEVLEGDREEVDRLVREFNSRCSAESLVPDLGSGISERAPQWGIT